MRCPFCKSDIRAWDTKTANYIIASQDTRGHTHVHHSADYSQARNLLGVMEKELDIRRSPVLSSDLSDVPKRLILRSGLSPGDILMLTIAVRDLHLAYPKTFTTDIRTPCPEIWEHNPYITPLLRQTEDKDLHTTAETEGITIIECHYPIIHQSGWSGLHFSDGYRKDLEEQLGIPIPRTGMTPDLYLSDEERQWTNQVAMEFGYGGKFWLLDAGHKADYTLKGYPPEKWQQAVTMLGRHIQLIQVGCDHPDHIHPQLEGVWNLVGKTDLRQLIRLVYWAEGIISCVSLPMVLAATLGKPAVVVAGGREGSRWQMYPNHRFLTTNGCLPCAPYDGCWASRIEDCRDKAGGIPKCFQLIRPEDIVRAVEMCYEGGIVSHGGPPSATPNENN